MVTEVYFIEGLYLYTEVGSSVRGMLASMESFVQGPLVVHCKGVRRWTLYWWWTFQGDVQVKGFKVMVVRANR
jgi:hypothetical protein